MRRREIADGLPGPLQDLEKVCIEGPRGNAVGGSHEDGNLFHMAIHA